MHDLIPREDTTFDQSFDTQLAVLDDELVIDKLELKVTVGPDAGLARASDGAELSIGKAQGNHLVLSDPAISRHHCTIVATPRGLLLRDLGSTNGTRVNGVRVESAYLDKRSVIALGATVLEANQLEEKIREPLARDDHFGPLLGRSSAMRRLFALLPRLAYSDSTMLLEGETGTGKSLLATAIHNSGPRASGPLSVADCSATTENLLFSAFENAKGGTLLIEEIGELPLELQPKLLRALEAPARDVRVIATTARDLRNEVNRQTFRSDLYYRLNVLKVRLPPLRDRREDIPLLIRHFRDELGLRDLKPELTKTLVEATWPGNIRELRTAIERTTLLGDPRPLELEVCLRRDEPSNFDPRIPFRAAKEAALARWEVEYLAELMRKYQGNISRASRGARMDRNHLRELLRRHAIPTGKAAG